MFDAKAGVEPQSENVWRQADTYNVPRMAFINKMDKMGADFFMSVQTIIDRLGKNAIPVQIPIGKEDDFIGLIDLFEMDAYYYKNDEGTDIEITEVPDDLKDLAQEWHDNLIEKVCELDDDLLEKYLDRKSTRLNSSHSH